MPPDALAALIRTLSGAGWAPPSASLAALAKNLRPATLGGVRILPAGRLGRRGFLLVREAEAMAPPTQGALWDGRFRVKNPTGDDCGALGQDAASLRRASQWPSAILKTLPALRRRGKLVVVPHLRYGEGCDRRNMVFAPAVALAAAPFCPG